jgi:hypothetical protein
VTVAVVSAIQPKLLRTEIAMAAQRRPENLTAYDLYLRALPQFYRSTREGVAESLWLTHRALELDPRFGFVAALAGVRHMEQRVTSEARLPRRRLRFLTRDSQVAYAFIAPAFFLLVILTGGPFVLSVWLSLGDARVGNAGNKLCSHGSS